jgi:transposase-like protein
MTTKKDYMNRHLSPAKKAWIIRKIKSGKSKYQTTKELGVSHKTVYRLAKDLPGKPYGWPGI